MPTPTPAASSTPAAASSESVADARRLSVSSGGDSGVGSRGLKQFATSHQYMRAMTEDLADWLGFMHDRCLSADSFFEELDNGELLCSHAAMVQAAAAEAAASGDWRLRVGSRDLRLPASAPRCRRLAPPGSFVARDNVAQFIAWCRQFGLHDSLLFETEDLVSRKNTRHVVLCLLEVARLGARFGMEVPELVQFEQEIDAELSGDSGLASPATSTGAPPTSMPTATPASAKVGDAAGRRGPPPAAAAAAAAPLPPFKRRKARWQCDLKSLDELVRELVSECTCEQTFPMKRLDDGKYLFGDSQLLIFVRVLRNHVMVRVGGGWDSLEHLLQKHDPCRQADCRSGGTARHHDRGQRRKEAADDASKTRPSTQKEEEEKKKEKEKEKEKEEFARPRQPAPSSRRRPAAAASASAAAASPSTSRRTTTTTTKPTAATTAASEASRVVRRPSLQLPAFGAGARRPRASSPGAVSLGAVSGVRSTAPSSASTQRRGAALSAGVAPQSCRLPRKRYDLLQQQQQQQQQRRGSKGQAAADCQQQRTASLGRRGAVIG